MRGRGLLSFFALAVGVALALSLPVAGQMEKMGSSGSGSGDALVADPLSQFAPTTSAQLRGVISDELGTGALLFDGATPTGFVLTNATGLPEAQVTAHEAAIDHDALANFVADEHVAHGGVTLTAGEGLTGGGTIAANRTFDLDVNGLTEQASPTGAADYVAIYDAGLAAHRKVLLDNLPASGGDIISEGNSNVEVIDGGTGQVDIDIDGANAFQFTSGGLLIPGGTENAPSLHGSDIDTGIFFQSTGFIQFTVGGSQQFRMDSPEFDADNASGPSMANVSATSGVATFRPNKSDGNSGLGWSGADAPAIVAGGVEGLIATELSSGVVLQYQTTAGITASVTQTQGQQPLVSTINEVSTVANTNDTVTLASAIAGSCQIVINNGANQLQIFPASGDSIDGGSVDAAVTLASGSKAKYCAYDATNWESF